MSSFEPIEIENKEKSEQKEIKKKRSEEGIRKFRERLEDVSFEREGVQEGLRELVEKMRKAVTKKRMKIQKWRPGRKKRWNKECREIKTELTRKLREYKAGKIDRKEFAAERNRQKKICKEREEKQRKEKIEKIMNLKDETEIWKYIGKTNVHRGLRGAAA